jgi:hypothetical protein
MAAAAARQELAETARAEKTLEEIDAEIAALGLPDEPPAPPPTATLAIQIDELFGLCGADKPEGLRLVELVGHLEAELVGSVDEGGKKTITDRIDALRAIFN